MYSRFLHNLLKGNKEMEFKHIPVLLSEVIDGLKIKKNGIYVDCTIGGGGHSAQILKRLSKDGHLYGFDRDQEAIEHCKNKFKSYPNITLFHSNFKNAPKILKENGVEKIDGFLIDLGVSSYQIDNAERGFSFNHNGILDMRMDSEDKLTAYQIVNSYSKERLVQILYQYGEEANAKKIVENIINARKIKPIETTFQLKDIIEKSFPKRVVFGKGGVSKKTFQALRIEVNGELDGLRECLLELISMLNKGGRGAVLTFHSLEDRIVKTVFKEEGSDCLCPPKVPVCICGHKASIKLLNKKPITATEEELKLNPRSSSAKLRLIEKI